jgi:glutamate racemase
MGESTQPTRPTQPTQPVPAAGQPGRQAAEQPGGQLDGQLDGQPGGQLDRQQASQPVGIFDSGVGGLSVLREISAHLPNESLIYCADSRYAPYGKRDDDFIADRSLAIGNWLIARGAKALVVACNTATAQTIHIMRQHLSLPIIGVEPGIKPAAALSHSRVVGVLATEATLRSVKFQRLLAAYQGDCRFICQPGHGLVQAIEQGECSGPRIDALLTEYLTPMLAAGADILVLGCTHYPFLDKAIRSLVGDRMTLVETGSAIARQLGRQLVDFSLAAPFGAASPARFYSTAEARQLSNLALSLLNIDALAESIVIDSRRTLDLTSAP